MTNINLKWIFLLAILSTTASAAPSPIEIVGQADYGVSLFLAGKLGNRFLLCQGEDYPVQFKITYGGTPGAILLSVTKNFRAVAENIPLAIQAGDSASSGTYYNATSDFGQANFRETSPSNANSVRLGLELRRSNLAVDNASPGLSFNTREIGITGQVAGQPYFHSFHSSCGFYEGE